MNASKTETAHLLPKEVFLVELRVKHLGIAFWEHVTIHAAVSFDAALAWSKRHVQEIVEGELDQAWLAIISEPLDGTLEDGGTVVTNVLADGKVCYELPQELLAD